MAGQKIHDHGSWVGGKSKGSVFPEGVKTKNYTSAEGDGAMSPYEDTTEMIKKQQMHGVSKMKSHAQKSGMRN